MRTPELQPQLLAELKGYPLVERLLQSPEAGAKAVQQISEQRRRALATLGLMPDSLARDLGGGKILATDFETDLCAAASGVSLGFFDFDDLPGWDTWFHHKAGGRRPIGRVYCWIPPDLVEFVNVGLVVIPIHFMEWLHSLDEVAA